MSASRITIGPAVASPHERRIVEAEPEAKHTPAKRGKWTVAAIVFALAAIAAVIVWRLFFAGGGADEKKSATTQPGGGRAIPVIVAVAKTADVPLYLIGLGTVTPYNTVTVRSRVDGEIMKLAFREGQDVRAGDLLAEIDPRTLNVQLSQAQSQQAKDAALLANAKADLERYQSAGTSVNKQELDTAASLVAQYEATIKSDQAAIDNVKLQLFYAKVTSPIAGRVGLKLVDQGNLVRASDATGIAVVTQLRPITVTFNLPQVDLPRVIAAMSRDGKLVTEAWDRDYKNKLAAGTLLALDNQIDATTGTVKLKAEFANDDGKLYPNQFVNIRLLVETRKNAVVINSAAVQRGPDGSFAYLVDGDGKVEIRTIKVGPTEGEQSIIDDGLAAKDRVVTDGVDRLQNGSTVTMRDGKEQGKDKSDKSQADASAETSAAPTR